jgi:flavin reductase (DIM6/NTAB) family NADH-FMN oxidoreductase RutF
VPYQRGEASGALIVEGGLAALECAAAQVIPAGDHLLVIARGHKRALRHGLGRASYPFPA